MSPGDLFVSTIVEGLAGLLIGIFNALFSAVVSSVFAPILEQLMLALGIGG